MCFRFPEALRRPRLLAVIPLLLAAAPAHRVLRVCADPNNLPFSNRRREGFENRLAEIVARELHASLRYTWWAQRRGFVRNTLGAGRCDLVMGLPAGDDRVLTTHPYYHSTYVFLSRRAAGLGIRSLDDPRLRRLKIGVHFIGDDYHNTPAAAALSRRGLARNLVGYSIYGDYSRPNPPARLIDAVAEGAVDVAVVWGPFAGYFGPRARVPLVSSPVTPSVDGPGLPFVFAIAAGVRRGDTTLRTEVDRALSAARPEVRALLARYGVPLAGEGGAKRVAALKDAGHHPARQQGHHDPEQAYCHPEVERSGAEGSTHPRSSHSQRDSLSLAALGVGMTAPHPATPSSGQPVCD